MSAATTSVTPTAPLGSIAGTVTDLDDGMPLPGVVVTLMRDHPTWEIAATTTTDGAGSYEFSDLAPETYRIRYFDGSGTYARAWWESDPTYRTADSVAVAPESTTVADAELTATAGQLKGRAMTGLSPAEVTPLPGISVLVFDVESHSYVAGAVTGANGFYTVGGLRPADSYVVYFRDPSGGFSPQWYRLADGLDGATTVSMTSGTVTWASAWMDEK